MCGIIGYLGSQNTKGVLLDGLKRLEYRGYDSAGIAIQEKDNKTVVFRSEGRIENLEKKLENASFIGNTGIGHTRWATHGAPTEDNAHPHQIGAITLIQNGIIENYLELKEKLQKKGREFKSETDTEIVAHLYDLEVTAGKNLKEATLAVIRQIRGSYALVVMSEKESHTLVAVKNGPPLLVGVGKDEIFFASDAQAILHRTNKVIYLEDDQAVYAQGAHFEIFDVSGKPIVPAIKTLDWTPDQLDKQGYRHYMLKEIHEQPSSIANTLAGNLDIQKNRVHLNAITPLLAHLKDIRKIFLVACGTARHAGLIGKEYLEQFTGIPVEVDFASEFRYRKPLLDSHTLLILVSQSGETADTLAALREGKKRGVKTISICNVRESSLARESDVVLYTNAGPEIGVASTKAFVTQVTMLMLLAIEFAQQKETLNQAQISELVNDLRKLPLLIEKALKEEKKIEKVALDHHPDTFFFYMARGINTAVAFEGALKLKEISYLYAEGYPSGELKHGPIALVDRRTVILNLSPKETPYETFSQSSPDLLYEKQMSNLQEVKARGGKIISIGSEGEETLPKESLHFIGIPKASWALMPILLTIPLQLFAYYIASFRGTDVDKPRNLAKSVTVE